MKREKVDAIASEILRLCINDVDGLHVKPMIQRCPECLSQIKLIRDGIISKCIKCGGQYDPTYVMGFTDGYNKGIRKIP